MYYAMQLVEGCATRVGRMTTNPEVAIRAAERAPHGYVEQYGSGVVWTPSQGWLGLGHDVRVASIRN